MQVGSLVNAEGDLTALDVSNSLSNVGGDGAGLGVRHQATGAEHASHTANLGHLVGGCDSSVEVGPATLDLLDQVLGANNVSASSLSLGCLLASGENDDADGLTGAVGQGDSAANQLVSLAGVDAETHCNVNGSVVVLGAGFLDDLSGLQGGVQAAGVDLLGGGAVCLRALAHFKILFRFGLCGCAGRSRPFHKIFFSDDVAFT